MSDRARVGGGAYVGGFAYVGGEARVGDRAYVRGNTWVSGKAHIDGKARVNGNAYIEGDARINGEACYTTIKGFGTEFRNTTFFRCKDNKIRVQCGCFYGDIDEFREQVKRTRNGKIAKEYLMIADLMEYHFSEEK